MELVHCTGVRGRSRMGMVHGRDVVGVVGKKKRGSRTGVVHCKECAGALAWEWCMVKMLWVLLGSENEALAWEWCIARSARGLSRGNGAWSKSRRCG